MLLWLAFCFAMWNTLVPRPLWYALWFYPHVSIWKTPMLNLTYWKPTVLFRIKNIHTQRLLQKLTWELYYRFGWRTKFHTSTTLILPRIRHLPSSEGAPLRSDLRLTASELLCVWELNPNPEFVLLQYYTSSLLSRMLLCILPPGHWLLQHSPFWLSYLSVFWSLPNKKFNWVNKKLPKFSVFI